MKTRLFCMVLVLAAACQTTDEGSSPDVIEQRVFDQLKKAQSIEELPPHLWSPRQRRASAGFYYLVAEYLGMQGDAMTAKDLIARAYDLDPNAFLGTKLVATEIQGGDQQRAIIDARKMVLLYPKSPVLHLLNGEILARQKALPEAIKETETAVALDPKSENAHIQLLTLYRQNNQMAEAIATARRMTQAFPASIIAWSLLSRLHMLDKNHAAALVAAEKAYQLQSSNDELGFIYAYSLELNPARRQEAIPLYRQLFSKVPSPSELSLRTGILSRLWEKPEDAARRLAELSQLSGGTSASLEVQRAYLLWELKRYEEAAAILDQLTRANPDSPLFTYMAAQGHERLGHAAKAAQLYQQVASESEYFVLARYRLTEVYQRAKQLDKALATILALVPHKYATWESYMIAARIYGDLNQLDAGIAMLAKGIAKHPNKVKLIFLKGVLEERAGYKDECVASMQAVISKDPTYSSAYNYLGYLYAEEGERLDEAEALIIKALTLKPNDGYYLDSLGWVYFKREDYDKALVIFQQAARLAPQEGVILEHIGDVYERQGKYKFAKEHYQKALGQQLEDRDRARIQEKINDLPAEAK